MENDIVKRAIDLTRDSLQKNFHLEEVVLPYEPKDGKFYFFISTYKFFDNVKKKLNEEFGENNDPILYDSIKNKLREQISKEEGDEVIRILERKLEESKEIGRTKGLYKTTLDFLKDNSDRGFKEWEKDHAPNLKECAKGFLIVDECLSEPRYGPKCGNCGDYLFLEKKKDAKDRDAPHEVMNLEQVGLIVHVAEKIAGSIDKNKENKFGEYWAKTLGEVFRDTLENKLRLKEQRGDKKEDILDGWIIYKNFIELIEKFS